MSYARNDNGKNSKVPALTPMWSTWAPSNLEVDLEALGTHAKAAVPVIGKKNGGPFGLAQKSLRFDGGKTENVPTQDWVKYLGFGQNASMKRATGLPNGLNMGPSILTR